MSGQRSESVDPIVDAIALALEPYDIPTGRSWTAAERREPAERIVRDLGIYLLGCLDPLGGFHMATSDHEHEEGDPSCRLVVALNTVHFGSTNAEQAR